MLYFLGGILNVFHAYQILQEGKPAWVVRTRNWKLRGGENRLSGLLEGVSIASLGKARRQGGSSNICSRVGKTRYPITLPRIGPGPGSHQFLKIGIDPSLGQTESHILGIGPDTGRNRYPPGTGSRKSESSPGPGGNRDLDFGSDPGPTGTSFG
ncbi:hypothetical protein V6N11_060064 [Hibiscus sabdariffa]|uniref:Uncharacterized protein n=1 Tax=Hibiscus sabdariffa TaxID=183260 RepID=A0ABR1ZEG8_9ROSI